MTPIEMKRLFYMIISVLIIITIYPYVKNEFYVSKYSELAILGPNGEVGKYPKEIHIGQELPLNIYIKNHEKETELYKIIFKLVQNSTSNFQSEPLNGEIVASYIKVLEDDKSIIFPIRIIIDKSFNGRIIAELYIFDKSTSNYVYDYRWVAIWMKTLE